MILKDGKRLTPFRGMRLSLIDYPVENYFIMV